MAFTIQPIVVNDTVDFVLDAKKDGAVWDISGGDVELSLKSPDGTVTPFNATINDGPAGQAHYKVAEDVLDTAGDWVRQWKVDDGDTVLRSAELTFSVEPKL